MIFDEFSIGKKSAKNPTFGIRGQILGESPLEMARVGGQGGVRKRLWSLQKSELNLTRLATPLDETGAADPNAPSGASTAAPYFGARRSLQLVALCSLQILNRSLMSAFLLAFNFWRFLRYLHVLYVFCEFVLCLAALAIFKSCCKKRVWNVSITPTFVLLCIFQMSDAFNPLYMSVTMGIDFRTVWFVFNFF